MAGDGRWASFACFSVQFLLVMVETAEWERVGCRPSMSGRRGRHAIVPRPHRIALCIRSPALPKVAVWLSALPNSKKVAIGKGHVAVGERHQRSVAYCVNAAGHGTDSKHVSCIAERTRIDDPCRGFLPGSVYNFRKLPKRS
jgi:hypothetical protein